MNAKFVNKYFWSQIVTVFMIVMLVLAALPIQSAYAATAGFSAPSIYSNSALLNAGYAFVSDNLYAQSTGSNKSAEYGNFGFNIPAGSIINLIEISVEGHGNKNWKVAVSKNNGASYSAFTTIINTAPDVTTVTGGTGTLWGLTGWTPASLNDANFRVKIASAGGNPKNVAYLNQLMVKVTYSLASSTPTTLVLTAPSAGTYGGTVNLQATLTRTSGSLPLSGKTVSFTLDGFSKGTAITNASGVATLNGVTLSTGLSGTLLNVGTYNVAATFQGDSTYAFSSDSKSQVINQRVITVSADAKSKVYGAVDPALTYTFAPALIGTDTFSGVLTRVAGENIGTHAITQGTLALSPNYAITYVGANLTITSLGITVTADNKAVHAGDPDPTFTFGVSRFVGSDAFNTSPTCGVSVAHTVAGTYPIVCSGGDAGINYSITYNSGTLTVTNKVVLTVTADPKSIAYGDPDPAFTFAYLGFVDGDTAITGTSPTCSVAGPHKNVSSYPSIVCSGGIDSKYEFSYTSGTLTVNPLAVTVTADPQNKTYGAADPLLTYGVSPALVSGDSFSGALVRDIGEDVAAYTINQATLALNENYTLTYVGASLTINKAPLTVTADNQTIGFGAPDPVFTFQYDGFVNGEDASVIDTSPTCGVLIAHTALGTYPIVCSGGLDNNYSFVFVNGTLLVTNAVVEAYVSGNLVGSYALGVSQSAVDSYFLSNGPVEVKSTNNAPIIAAERVIFSVNNTATSYSELMGLPKTQLATSYLFPWYNNQQLNSQLRFGNVGSASTIVSVKIHGTTQATTYTLAPGASTTATFPVSDGPVEVFSNGQNIIAAERVIFSVNNTATSYSELMGLPKTQATTSYLFPWYNNQQLNSQLRFGNVGSASTIVSVKIHGATQATTYTLAPGESTTATFPASDGPVEVFSDGQNIIAAERVIFTVNGAGTSYSELMGLPKTQATTSYTFPWYNNQQLNSQLRFGNVGTSSTIVSIKIHGVTQAATYTLAPGESTTATFPVSDGPIEVFSDGQNIIAAERVIFAVNNTSTSYSELMGLPQTQLATSYLFPWYNNLQLNSQLRFGAP